MAQKIKYIYPGTFCPPHYGHIALAKEAAEVFGGITVVCSVNPVKKEKGIFSPEECKEMWQTYDLGKDIEVVTLEEFLNSKKEEDVIVMIRGIRDNNDIIYENDVMIYNRDHFGVTHYHYIICAKPFEKMSSSLVREYAKGGNFEKLGGLVNPQVATRLAERYNKR